MPEGLRALEKVAQKWQLELEVKVFGWAANCDYYLERGKMEGERL